MDHAESSAVAVFAFRVLLEKCWEVWVRARGRWWWDGIKDHPWNGPGWMGWEGACWWHCGLEVGAARRLRLKSREGLGPDGRRGRRLAVASSWKEGRRSLGENPCDSDRELKADCCISLTFWKEEPDLDDLSFTLKLFLVKERPL